jgi:hypothetical protein
MAWKKGESGNPGGKARGAKDRFTRKFWTDWFNEWEIGGPDAISKVRLTDPGTFVRIAASLMPKETEVTLKNEFDRMTDAELREFIARELASSGGSSEGEETPESPAVTH